MIEYLKDGRKSIWEIYSQLDKLTNYTKEILYEQKIKSQIFPILAYKSKIQGKAVWLLAGIHGEEPAGVNAIAENINFLNNLGNKFPLVILPICNQKGYFLGWRYPNAKKWQKGKPARSVGSSEHFLLKGNQARIKKPLCKEAKKITNFVINNNYPPLFSLDLHEDSDITKGYVYSQGKFGLNDKIAKEAIKILKKQQGVILNGKTDNNEKIQEGIISDAQDGSIDELFASEKIFVNNKIKQKIPAISAIVIETGSKIPLKKRIKSQSAIIKAIPKFRELIK